jgi:hypothetical protein
VELEDEPELLQTPVRQVVLAVVRGVLAVEPHLSRGLDIEQTHAKGLTTLHSATGAAGRDHGQVVAKPEVECLGQSGADPTGVDVGMRHAVGGTQLLCGLGHHQDGHHRTDRRRLALTARDALLPAARHLLADDVDLAADVSGDDAADWRHVRCRNAEVSRRFWPSDAIPAPMHARSSIPRRTRGFQSPTAPCTIPRD